MTGHSDKRLAILALPCAGPFPLTKSGLVLKCAVEQRLARQAHNLEVVGSIPTGAISTTRCQFIKPPRLAGFVFASMLTVLDREATIDRPGPLVMVATRKAAC